MTLQCARARRGKRCRRERNENEASPETRLRSACARVCVYQGYQAASESSHWSRRAEKEEEGGGGGGGARGRQKDCAIKGQREPWWSSRASRCFEFKASFQDVKSRSVFAAHTGRGKQTKGKCIFEGFVPWFNFFTVSSTPPTASSALTSSTWSICISSTSLCVSLLDQIHVPQTGK